MKLASLSLKASLIAAISLLPLLIAGQGLFVLTSMDVI
jgi:methyl-accepting chemotaxis protein